MDPIVKSILFLFLLLSTVSSQAEEGLYIGPPPVHLQACWDSTVSMDLFGPNGSGVIVQTKDLNDKIYEVYVLTAYHVWKGWLNQFSGDEKAALSGALVDFEFWGKKRDAYYETDSLPLASGATGIAVNENSDLTLLRFDLDKSTPEFNERIERLKNLKIPKFADCSQLHKGDPRYAIGFPKVWYLDQAENRTLFTQQPNVLQKRWSQGALTAKTGRASYLTKEFKVKNPDVMSLSTVDVIKGNSGGPVCDGTGSLVGIASGATRAPVNYGMLYTTKCEETKKFVAEFTSENKIKNYREPEILCNQDSKNSAVITSARALRNGPSGEALDQMVQAGEMVEILKSEGPWTKIRLSNGREGWVSTAALRRC